MSQVQISRKHQLFDKIKDGMSMNRRILVEMMPESFWIGKSTYTRRAVSIYGLIKNLKDSKHIEEVNGRLYKLRETYE